MRFYPTVEMMNLMNGKLVSKSAVITDFNNLVGWEWDILKPRFEVCLLFLTNRNNGMIYPRESTHKIAKNYSGHSG